MIMACGTGKTLAALFIKEKLAAQRTLVLVPSLSLSLLAQTLCEWRANQPHRSRLSLPARCT
jgi:predicted helicase